MTVSKTTTQEKARETFGHWLSENVVIRTKDGKRSPTIGDVAAFADSLTAELQKENARLREALEYGLEGHVIISPHSRKIECNCGICEVSRAALSKEKAK